jgi:choline-sulfatase
MADQLAASALGCYGHPLVLTPHLDGLARSGCLFTRAYCNSPICAASRASLMTGQLPSAIGVYDNGAELPAAVPTFCHALRTHGYRTVLAGKMHFIGPDQLHGFEERRTTDIYPAGMDWTPDWGEGVVHNPGASVRGLEDAGPAAASLQLDYDEEVLHAAVQCIYDHARRPERPLFLCISFTHPHDPFVITPHYWNLYREVPPPRAPAEPWETMHPYARWLQTHHELDLYPPSPAVVQRARRAYLGMVSYLDDLVARVLTALNATGLRENSAVIFTSDHGEMLGEHGMWYKRVFYEDSARVPFVLTWPGRIPPGRQDVAVSLLDLAPTICDLAGIPCLPEDPLTRGFAGRSLLPLARGDVRPAGGAGGANGVIGEYMGEGVVQPCRMLVAGNYKAVFVRGEQGQLFDLCADPLEQQNLAGRREVAELEARLLPRLLADFDPDRTYAAIRASQTGRQAIARALACGREHPWDFEAPRYEASRYVRRETVPVAAQRRHLTMPRPMGTAAGPSWGEGQTVE